MSPLFNPPQAVSVSDSVFSSGTFRLTGGPNITVGSDASGGSISGAAQTVQTQNMHNVTLSGNTAGAMAQVSSGTMTLAGGPNITVSQAGNAVSISGPAPGGGAAFTLSASNTSFSNSAVLSGSNAVTVRSTTGQAFIVDAPVQTAQTGLSGVVASNATYTSGTFSITGVGGGITVSSNTGQRVDLSVAAPVAQTAQTQNVHNVTLSGNTAGAMAHISSGTMTLAGGPNITVSQAGNAVSISGPAPGGGAAPTLSYFDNMGAGSVSTAAIGALAIGFNSLVLQPMTPFNELFPGAMTASTAMLNISHPALTATASSSSFTSSFMIGIYTRVNGSQLSLLNSVVSTFARTANTGNSSLFSGGGMRWVTFHSSLWSTAPEFGESRYWFGVIARSSNFNVPGTSMGQWLIGNTQRRGTFGSSVAVNQTMKQFPFMGVHLTSQTAFPASIADSQIGATQASAAWIPHLVFNNYTSVL